jgi:retron-type reverse transcriptase
VFRTPDADLEDCFGSILHQELMDMIARRIVDGKALWLIKLFLKAGVMKQG